MGKIILLFSNISSHYWEYLDRKESWLITIFSLFLILILWTLCQTNPGTLLSNSLAVNEFESSKNMVSIKAHKFIVALILGWLCKSKTLQWLKSSISHVYIILQNVPDLSSKGTAEKNKSKPKNRIEFCYFILFRF